MLKKIILLLTITTLYSAEITNIVVQQRTDGSGIIDVTYDLIDSDGIYPSFNVSIEINIDETEYSTLSSGDVSGDIGENVIPGVSKSIQIQAPGDTYSDNVVVKIIASATVVSGELPFTMISIASVEGVSSYQEETINYNFQMMQYELTNADLVTFLETYDFTLDENGDATYDCGDYTEYFNSGSSDDGCEDCIYGCTEQGAMNYNPDANVHTECIYEHQVGCTDPNASNYCCGQDYDDQMSNGLSYEDCSCFYTQTDEGEDVYSWVTMPGCNWTQSDEGELLDVDTPEYLQNMYLAEHFSEWFTFMDNYHLEINLCDDSNAQNYPENLGTLLNDMSWHIDPDCWSFTGFDSCIYEDDCDMSYLDSPSGTDDDTDYGTANISDFSTQHISFEGVSFVIESGAGEKPALFNYDECTDGVIVGLLLDYYGLRFPTGGEWTKAARQDNNRCWPWMNTNCEVANEAYCSSEYQCLSQEDFDACQDSVEQTQLDCNNQCSIDQNACNESCGCTSNSGDGDTDCNDYDGDQGGCEDNEDCTWLSDTCVDACYGCMMDEENYDNCIICEDNDCDGNPCFDGCPCCGLCDMSGGGDSCDNDCQLDCQIDQNNCNSDCNEYNNSWEYCGGQDMNDCENNYSNCSNEYSWNDCEQIWGETLEELLDGSYSGDEYGFLSTIYQNKFFNTYQSNFGEEWDNESLDLADVGQYPEGLSPFGLYDMIGNAPEMVKHENLLWLTGLTPNQSPISSFCANDNQIFDQSNYNNSHATGMSSSYGGNFNLYGLRLARTTQ